MEEINYVKCPYCGSEETQMYEDWIYEFGYTERDCSDCNKHYIVHFETIATCIRIIE